jgi:lysophospholipase L1-like esterase
MKLLHSTAALTGALLLLLSTAGLPAQTTPAVTPTPSSATVIQPVSDAAKEEPSPIREESRPDVKWWLPRHEEKLARIRQGNVNLLFLGDSITHQWDSPSKDDASNFLPLWQEFYGDRNAVNLGFSGDETQNLLWRIDHGEVDGITPKTAVVMIGTNNSGKHPNWTVTDNLSGIIAVVEDLHRHLPQTQILLLGIFPSKISPEKSAKDKAVNDLLEQTYLGSSYVQYLDIGNAFRKNGEIDPTLFRDKTGICLHPNVAGQRIWGETIEPFVAKMLGDTPKTSMNQSHTLARLGAIHYEGATTPFPRDRDWLNLHQKNLELIHKQPVDLIFLGDSITNNWDKTGPAPDQVFQPIWQEFYGDRKAFNLGVSGDETQHVLWRLQNGEVDGLSPKVVVLMIGTNNTWHHGNLDWQDVLAGEIAVVDELHRRLPKTKVLLLGIFPSGVSTAKTIEDENINRALGQLYEGSSYVTFLDIKNAFYKNGKLDESLFYDTRLTPPGRASVHPDTVGQRKWAEAIEPTLSQLLGDKNKLKK